MDKFSRIEKELFLIALGDFNQESVRRELEWHKDSYEIDFENNYEELHILAVSLYDKILFDLEEEN